MGRAPECGTVGLFGTDGPAFFRILSSCPDHPRPVCRGRSLRLTALLKRVPRGVIAFRWAVLLRGPLVLWPAAPFFDPSFRAHPTARTGRAFKPSSALHISSERNSATMIERHFRVRQLAELWGFSDQTIIRMFADEPGVLRLGSNRGRRTYTSLSIPESVALRVHERFSQQALKPAFPAGNPLRVVRLRNLDARMSQKPRNVLKLKSA